VSINKKHKEHLKHVGKYIPGAGALCSFSQMPVGLEEFLLSLALHAVKHLSITVRSLVYTIGV